jgi:hypothetical protein
MATSITADLFDMHGQKIEQIVCKDFPKGNQSIAVNMRDVLPGVYFCRIKVGNSSIQTIKIVHLKQ